MVAQLNEGITLTLERSLELIGISEVHFRNTDFAYITVRRNSYAVDPTIYTHIKELKHLKAFAIVSQKKMDKHNFKIEKHFFGNNKPMGIFNEFDNALEWINTIMR
ncbi:STAS/SEC14 domain-containing protein [Leptobacterium flavescens]|uniref:STAS/SEC14 domain-containing protein n=1 Tax=Leptobacterium flavescens TaxID=472055 RepID=A0A6P0UFU0_9FLAO|nr:STAS/SEC14 domain-containing protein [Leptobacterium flavescens]NER11887.1 STAS/SEC14 domain-containing protein [Leptobacterium flavescens]